MDLIVNWDGLQFGSTRNTHLYLFVIFLFSTLLSRTVATTQFHPDAQPPVPLLLLGWPPCTGPSRATTHRLCMFSHHHFTHLTVGCPGWPSNTHPACVVWDSMCATVSLHLATMHRPYICSWSHKIISPVSSSDTVHRQVSVHICMVVGYILFLTL